MSVTGITTTSSFQSMVGSLQLPRPGGAVISEDEAAAPVSTSVAGKFPAPGAALAAAGHAGPAWQRKVAHGGQPGAQSHRRGSVTRRFKGNDPSKSSAITPRYAVLYTEDEYPGIQPASDRSVGK